MHFGERNDYPITFRCIGEMEDQRALDPDPEGSWVDLSTETDSRGVRRAYVHLTTTPMDQAVWGAMDEAAFELAAAIAGIPANLQWWNKASGQWQDERPQPAQDARSAWQDSLGTGRSSWAAPAPRSRTRTGRCMVSRTRTARLARGTAR